MGEIGASRNPPSLLAKQGELVDRARPLLERAAPPIGGMDGEHGAMLLA